MIKYTPEQEAELSEAYTAADTDEAREAVIEDFMRKHGKRKRSIIAKLSKMRDANGLTLYKAKERLSKVTNTKPITKENIVKEIEQLMKVEEGDLTGLDKAPKLTLMRIVNELRVMSTG